MPMTRWLARFPEVWITASIVAITLAFALSQGLPFSLPSGERAAFVGIHYLYPLIGLCIWIAVAAVGQREKLGSTLFIGLPCYAIVLVCHFNLKLWIPHINPALWDDFFWATDEAIRPLIDFCIALSHAIAPVISLDGNFYMTAFILLFYAGFCYHAVKTPERFHTLFLAALILQGLGGLAYLAMPAIGPFLYEQGPYTLATAAQQSMYAAWQANVAGGAGWLDTYGGTHITVGLAAMPSLHAGGSFLFLLFAFRYAKPLAYPAALVFAYICVAAVATRWHYAIDIPVGMALALFSYWAAHRLSAPGSVATIDEQPALAAPAPRSLFARFVRRQRPAIRQISNL